MHTASAVHAHMHVILTASAISMSIGLVHVTAHAMWSLIINWVIKLLWLTSEEKNYCDFFIQESVANYYALALIWLPSMGLLPACAFSSLFMCFLFWLFLFYKCCHINRNETHILYFRCIDKCESAFKLAKSRYGHRFKGYHSLKSWRIDICLHSELR